MHPRFFLRTVRDVYVRFGWVAAAKFLLEGMLNLFMFFDCLHIIVLERTALKPLDSLASRRFDSRIATETELNNMSTDPRWEIGDTKLGFFRMGDLCVLSFVDGQPAGYTWVHTNGRPELIPGLTISIPEEYVYNYAGLTLADFRGAGLQSYRHHSVLDHERWKNRRALLGYVKATNFASRKGQFKSGYKKVGTLWLLGTRRHFIAIPSSSLVKMGVRRLFSKHEECEATIA